MPAKTVDSTLDEADRSAESARDSLRHARAALEQGRRALPELAKTAQRTFSEGLDRLGNQARDAMGNAGDQLDDARLYVVERVQERPLTVLLGALAAGFILGMLVSGSRR